MGARPSKQEREEQKQRERDAYLTEVELRNMERMEKLNPLRAKTMGIRQICPFPPYRKFKLALRGLIRCFPGLVLNLEKAQEVVNRNGLRLVVVVAFIENNHPYIICL
jgi:hypothetical protein